MPRLIALVDSLEAFRGDRATLLWSLALAVVAQFGNGLSMYFGFIAVQGAVEGTVSLLAATAITPLVTLTTIVPVTPLGIGVADAAAEGLFTLVGAHSGAEVTMLVRAATASACLLSGLAYLLPAPDQQEPGASEPAEPAPSDEDASATARPTEPTGEDRAPDDGSPSSRPS
jgi:uncharacterized membrane protein YbhN (UPF0104 family)